MPETLLLPIAGTGFVIAFLHAAIPTHWLPFVLTGRAQQWSRARTLFVTAIAGAGHVVLTAGIGAVVIWGGGELSEHAHEWFHAAAGAALVLIGLFYLARQWTGRGHVHLFGGHHHHAGPASSHGHAGHKHGHGEIAPQHDSARATAGEGGTPAGPHGGQTVDTGHGLIEARLSANDANGRVQLFFFARPGTPVPPPATDDMRLEILRPDGTQHSFAFVPAGDHLASTESVPTPHEFTAMLDLRHGDHVHRHELVFCEHEHPVIDQGVHAPATEDEAPTPVARRSDWAAFLALFAMLTFSPCEGFISVYIAGIDYGWPGFGVLTLALLIGSVSCMVLFTWLSILGLQRISLGPVRRYESGVLGALLCLLGVLLIFVE